MTNLEYFKEKLRTFLDSWYEEGQIDGYEADWTGEWEDELAATGKKFSCILEATLTDRQMMEWAPHMKEAGFKVVNRFLNSNSGNVVNVLHYNPAGEEGEERVGKVPYKW
jgi:hypothetical protein